MSRLHIYTVHINPSLPHPYEDAKFVEEGFNWKAFIFTGLWALYNRLWLAAILMFIINGSILVLTMHHSNAMGLSLIEFSWHLIIGYSGNDLIRSKLKKLGFIIADIVTGDSKLRAEQRFFDRYFAARNNTPAFVS